MPNFVLRLWVPDRPGALGHVASRIGAVRGDVVAIDILERGAGRAIDELVVTLPDESLVPLLVAEVGEVEGVDVEDVRPVAEPLPDARIDALETAALLVEQGDAAGVVDVLVSHARRDFEADWVAVVDVGTELVSAGTGDAPSAEWLAAFLAGTGDAGEVNTAEFGPDDHAWAPLPGRRLVLGRTGRPFRARERKQLAALARVAASRLAEL